MLETFFLKSEKDTTIPTTTNSIQQCSKGISQYSEKRKTNKMYTEWKGTTITFNM